eukprot:scaffold1253_cov430-Prasinococcus_capsulatus_cf.AAC.5
MSAARSLALSSWLCGREGLTPMQATRWLGSGKAWATNDATNVESMPPENATAFKPFDDPCARV